jgi:hypothetical protein
LTEVFRQAAKSRIIVNAHRINQGQMPELDRPERTAISTSSLRTIRKPPSAVPQLPSRRHHAWQFDNRLLGGFYAVSDRR